MKRIAFIIFSGALLVALAFSAKAQRDVKEPLVNDGVYVKETIQQRVPIPYPHLREADMLWTKRVWRMIDLRERMNHPLYYPTTRMHDRRSLVQVLMDAIERNEITAFDPEEGDEFAPPLLSYNQVLENLDAQDTRRADISPITGQDTVITIPGTVRWTEIRELMIKEEWFFDTRHSTMQVRILGICPIRVYADFEAGAGEIRRVQLFWVYYPHARTVLANASVFNERNDAQRNSFDDIFFKRRFSSYIIQESNVYNNRRINEYTFGGIPNMQESERIRYELFEMEHDLWEY